MLQVINYLTIVFFSFLLITKANCQEFTQENTTKLNISSPIIDLSVDRNNSILLLLDNKTIIKFDENWEIKNKLSFVDGLSFSDVEAFPTLRTLVFDKVNQQFSWVDRRLSNIQTFSFPNNIGFIEKCTSSTLEGLWLYELNNKALLNYSESDKKINFSIFLKQIIKENRFEVSHLRDFQNLLFVAVNNSICIIDYRGKLKKRILFDNEVSWFSFLDEQSIYTIINDEFIIIKFSLIKSKKAFSLPFIPDKYIAFKNQLFLIKENIVYCYSFK